MPARSIGSALQNLLARNLPLTVFSALLLAVALYGLVSLLTWLLYRIPGLGERVQELAETVGVSTPQLLEFNAIIVTGIFIAVQLWVTHRRAGAAEATATAALQTAEATVRTAESTVRRNVAQQFKDAVELLGNRSETVRMGGILALTFIARDYPEYQDAVVTIISTYIRNGEEPE